MNLVPMLRYVTGTDRRRNRVDDPGRDNPARFGLVVVATEYIGPLAAEPGR